MKWSQAEEDLLIDLRQAGVPYAKKLKHFPGRTQDGLRCKMDAIRNGWRIDDLPNQIIGVFDIETSNLKADVGYMLSWAVYYPNEDRIASDVITKRDISTFNLDKRICKSFLKELDNIQLLIGFYSTKFDIPYTRTRCLMNGLDYPGYGTIRHIDCFYAARGKVATRRKSLGVIAEALGLDEKTHEPIAIWNLARLGDKKSLAKLLAYNENDCKITWNVYNELKKYGKYTSKSI
jgi:uncharacterized protein YprB with RNaseH-like and TPR domain